MKPLSILLSLLLLGFTIVSAQSKKVLFLGNSYTQANNLPQLTAYLALSAGDTLIYDSNTPGGYTLQGHSTNTTSLSKIANGGWDFMVLQEQSQRPSFHISQVQNEVFPYAQILDSIFNSHNPCGETMFYMTWGRKNGDSYYCPNWPPVCSYQGMDSLLRMRYMMMASDNNAVVSPVGAVWRYIRTHYPSIELYSQDESHPSMAGSYAAACAFYASIFRKSPTLASFSSTLAVADAANIRQAAHLVVIDSLLQWHIGEYDHIPFFNYSNTSGFTFQFSNQSQNSDGHYWDIDGTTYHISNPQHTFATAGFKTATIFSWNHCDTLTHTETIAVGNAAILSKEEKDFKIWPNPVKDRIYFNIQAQKVNSIKLFSIAGILLIDKEQIHSSVLETAQLPQGIYIFRIETKDGIITRKICKE